MNVDSAIKMVEVVTHLLGVIVWPGVFAFVVIRFRAPIVDFISTMGEFSIKGAGIEAAAKVKTAAAAHLTAASASRQETAASPEIASQEVQKTVQTVARAITPRVIRRAERSTILWVDDRPNNNINERRALEAVGIKVLISISTDEALEESRRQDFDLIISDMGRPPDPRAGYTLLDKLRARGDHTPFVIYTGSRSPEHQEEALRHGALACTNRPSELFQIVLSSLGEAAP